MKSGSNTTLLYGVSGSTKTSNVAHFCRYIYETTGKKTRVISAEAGGRGNTRPLEPLVNAGVIELDVSLVRHPAALALMDQMSKGFWPAVAKSKTGAEILRLAKPEETDWSQIGAYVIEGVTSIGDVILSYLKGKGVKLSQDPSFSYVDILPPEMGGTVVTFHGGNMSYYGFVQDQIRELIRSFSYLDVDRILWTALESRGEEETTKQSIIGPDIAGRRAGPKLPAWVGECLHLHSPTVPGQGRVEEVHLYFTRHMDPMTNMPYPAKPRLPPQLMPELLAKWPDGYVPVDFEHGLDTFLYFEDKLMEKASTLAMEWKSRIDQKRSEAEPVSPVAEG